MNNTAVYNGFIELGENDGKGKGRYFQSRFIEAGIAHYDELGDILITKETLNKFINTMVGCPVIINHKDVTDKNADKLRVGTISRVWFNELDGWFYCEGIITDPQAIDLIKNQGWNVSCSYNFVSDGQKKTYHGKEISQEFVDGEFLHLAIVENPRYEGANIVVNSKEFDESKINRDESGRFAEKETSKQNEEIKYFDETKTGIFGYDEFLNDRQYAEIKKKIPKVVEMTPDEYIELCNEGFNHVYKKYDNPDGIKSKEELEETRKDKALENLKQNFGKTPFDMPMIDYDLRPDGDLEMGFQEGLHRAILAKEKGLKKMPVAIFVSEKYGDNIEVDALKEKLNEITKKYHIVDNSIERKDNIIMEILNDFKALVEGIVNNALNKEKEVENEEKEEIKEEIKEEKAENKCKAKNEVEEEEEKETVETEKEEVKDCKNEADKEEKEEKFEEQKEIAENEEKEEKEVKNSMDSVKDAIMGGNSEIKNVGLYTSQAERLELGNKF